MKKYEKCLKKKIDDIDHNDTMTNFKNQFE